MLPALFIPLPEKEKILAAQFSQLPHLLAGLLKWVRTIPRLHRMPWRCCPCSTGCYGVVVLFPLISACFTSQKGLTPEREPKVKESDVAVGSVWLQQLASCLAQLEGAWAQNHHSCQDHRACYHPSSLWVSISQLQQGRNFWNLGIGNKRRQKRICLEITNL